MAKKQALNRLILLLVSLSGIWVCQWILESAVGFPIDDAYIYKRYALNLAAGNGFSFNPGEPSFGCSSFLWTVLLAGLVKVFGPDHYLALAQWTGVIFTAWGLGLLLKLLYRHAPSRAILLAGAFFSWFYWVTFMNALSGMENGLFCFLIALNLYYLDQDQDQLVIGSFRQGLFAALAFLARPEGLYFALGFGALWVWKILRKKPRAVSSLAMFALGFFIIAGPYLWWAEKTFHQWGPFTYQAKLVTSYPGFLNRTFSKKMTDGGGMLVFGLGLLLKPWKIPGWILLIFAAAGCVYSALSYLARAQSPSLALAAGWISLPFVYGYSFPSSPYFGGYYQRYIATVWLAIVMLGLVGMDRIYDLIASVIPLFKKRKTFFYWAGLILVLVYCRPILKGQLRESREIYLREVTLNTGLRLQAADWLNRNTAKDAKILVGYTGLGVVGGESDREVFDILALINLDILDYIRGTLPLTDRRWQGVIKYVCARQLDYYVDFAPVAGPDPGKTPGLIEQARLGIQGEPALTQEQIRIFKIDRSQVCPPKKE